MITQDDKVKKENASRAEQITYCKDVIKAAARYERLMALKDFGDMLDDLRRLAKVHEDQISGWVGQIEAASEADQKEENPIFRQLRILEVIKTHQYRMAQIKEAINYPDKLIAVAIDARETLKLLTEEERKHATRSN